MVLAIKTKKFKKFFTETDARKQTCYNRRRKNFAQSKDYCVGAHPLFQRFELASVEPN